VGDCDRKSIYYRIIRTDNKEGNLLSILSKHKDKILIYCMTIKNCEYLYYQLLELGYKVRMYHGMLEKDDKLKSQNDFLNGISNIMIATNAFGMGIDIPNIRYVIEYDLPSSIEDFIQQVGRVSRDGKYGEGILLFDRRDISTNEYFIENIQNDKIDKKELTQIKLDRYQKLDKMIELALTSKCLHQLTSNYFGHSHPGKCYMCSNCKK
jgi:ATP-dependent DNA helicase RecQ